MSNPGPKHDGVLGLVGGIAALLVVASHLRALIFEAWAGGGPVGHAFYFLTALGHRAVIVFFVLSGYLVGGSVIFSAQRGAWDFRRHLLRRYVRLSIVLASALGLTLLFDSLGLSASAAQGLYAGETGNSLIRYNVQDRLSLWLLAGNFLFLQSILVDTFGSNGALWSLAYEFWFYLLFPALIVPFFRGRWQLILLSVVPLPLFVVLTGLQGVGYFCIWTLGALVAYIRKAIGQQGMVAGTLPILASGSVFAASLVLSVVSNSALFGEYFVAVAFAAFLALAVRRDVGPQYFQVCANFFAKISCSLYATHLPLVVLLAALVLRGERMAFGLTPIVIFCAMTFVVVILAYGVWWAFERHTQAVQNYFGFRKP